MKISTKRSCVLLIFFSLFILPYFYSIIQPAFQFPWKKQFHTLFLPGPICPDTSTVSCAFGELQRTLSFDLTYVMNDVLLPTLLASLGMLLIAGVVFGRAFCGWACPFGAFQDLLGSFRKRSRRLRPFTYSKFAMLLIVMILAWVTLDTFFCKLCPAGSLFAAIPAPFFDPSLRLGVFFFVHIATLILTILLVLLFSRFWCRYLCPVAPIGVFNKLSILTISVDSTKCTECLSCLEDCPMGIDKVSDIGSSSDCILCVLEPQ